MSARSVKAILQEAIEGEIASNQLYARAALMVRAPHVRDALLQLAEEELGHKATLERMLENPGHLRYKVRKLQAAPVEDFGIGDHLVVQPLGPDATFQDVCIFASKKEQASYLMYKSLAEQNDGEVRSLFEAMAKDEMRHKNLVEGWYEEVIYQAF
ncbi:MAG TPA: ferritin family protein [Anaerolineae bacterium]|nr:ferritin family protein [Anaerolineae bacterium]